MRMRMSSCWAYSRLFLDDIHFISLGHVDLNQEKEKEMAFNTENIISPSLQNRFMMKQPFVRLAKF